MSEKKSPPVNTEPSVIIGDFDLSSSTIELTGVLYEVKEVDKGKSQENLTRESNRLATSDFDALLHVIKSSLGSGVLASAEGFKNAGYIVGIIGTIIVGILCTHCTHIMVKCSQKMCKVEGKPSLGFGETVEAAMKNSNNKTLRRFATIGKQSADGFMFFTYYGVTTVYVLLVAESFQQIFENHVNVTYNIRIYILMVTIPIFMVGMIRSMKYLVPFSAIANLCLFVGLCLTFYFILKDLPPLTSVPAVAPISRFPLFFATVLFGMEGIGTMLPIENSMRNPTHFLGCPGVLNFSMTIVVTLFMLVGLLGYIKFGEAAKGSITLNLKQDIFSEVVKGLVALAILFSYGLQLTAAIDVFWRGIKSRFSEANQNKAYYMSRALIIAGSVIIAIAVPNLGPVISLIGAIGFSSCGFFYPALAETAILVNEGFGKWNWLLWKNIFLVIITVLAIVSGSVVSVADIIREYS